MIKFLVWVGFTAVFVVSFLFAIVLLLVHLVLGLLDNTIVAAANTLYDMTEWLGNGAKRIITGKEQED